jgi:hypothetical protein
MSYAYGSLAYELYRPTIARHVPIVGVVFLLGAFWVSSMHRNDSPEIVDHSVRIEPAALDSMTVEAGELNVPVYYFPDAAIGTDNYVEARELDCAGATNATAPDFPQNWLKP